MIRKAGQDRDKSLNMPLQKGACKPKHVAASHSWKDLGTACSEVPGDAAWLATCFSLGCLMWNFCPPGLYDEKLDLFEVTKMTLVMNYKGLGPWKPGQPEAITRTDASEAEGHSSKGLGQGGHCSKFPLGWRHIPVEVICRSSS